MTLKFHLENGHHFTVYFMIGMVEKRTGNIRGKYARTSRKDAVKTPVCNTETCYYVMSILQVE